MKKLYIILIMFSFILAENTRITKENQIYNNSINSVFTVYGDAGHGSGFLYDKNNGLIITNRHVVGNSIHLRVALNDSLKVNAKSIVSDFHNDISIIQINPSFTINLNELSLADNEYNLFVGETVYAIGSPLNQTGAITVGIISKLEENVILSDVNINPGNSGGPLLNNDEIVIGINTFGDISSRGPGLSGILKISKFQKILNEAMVIAQTANDYPSKEILPLMPNDIFPLDALKAAAFKKFNFGLYKVGSNDFNINITSPAFKYHRAKKSMLQMLEEREKLEDKSNLESMKEKILFEDLYSWRSNVGSYQPVIEIEVMPRVTVGLPSLLIGAALAVSTGGLLSVLDYEFSGDLYDFKLYRNDTLVTDLYRSVNLESFDFIFGKGGVIGTGQDLAQYGVFKYPIEIFKPSNDSFPKIRFEIFDLKNGIQKPTILEVRINTIAKIWEDFLPYTGDYESEELIKASIKPRGTLTPVSKSKYD